MTTSTPEASVASPTERRPSPQWEAATIAARTPESTWRALATAGLVTDAGVVCPTCGKGPLPSSKFKVQPSGQFKHFSSTGCHGDAAGILMAHLGVNYSDAVRVLNGKPTRGSDVNVTVAEIDIATVTNFTGVTSKIDPEVFDGVLVYGRKTGGVAAAQEFYGTWHISPQVVEASGAVMITDPAHFEKAILERFGLTRLLECGLFVLDRNQRPRSLVGERFPVVEPHRHPASGQVLYMQFRASHAQYQNYLAHKRGEREYGGSEKLISLKGAPSNAQIGTGLHLIHQLPEGSTVHIVEGFKDQLANNTAGLHAYGLPGTGVRPPEKILPLLARHKVVVAFDGDEAGQLAMNGGPTGEDEDAPRKEGLVDFLRRHGVDATAQVLPHGWDSTDLLVAHHASGRMTGTPCSCSTCTQFRTANPALFPTAG